MSEEGLLCPPWGEGEEGGTPSKIFITEDDIKDNVGEKEVADNTGLIHSVGGINDEDKQGDSSQHKNGDESDGSALSCLKSVDSNGELAELAKALDDVSTTEDEEEKAKDDEGVNDPTWKSRQRHIFVLSEAGKPIYSRHGNEDKLVTLFGVMQALVSVVSDDCDDTLRSIHVGRTSIVFLLKAPLILVCVSQVGDSVAQIQIQLTYFYNQIVSILTSKQLMQIFEKRRNYDLRRLIQGSERLLHNLAHLVETDPSFVLGAVRCLPLASSVRDTISQTISQTLSKLKHNVVFAILLANKQLVSLVRMKKCFMHPADLHLIANLIDASESFKTAETWSPLCLPRFDSSGFVHAHVSYLTDECQACLVLLTVDRESFFPLSEAKQKIVEKLKRQNCLDAIKASMKNAWPTMSFIDVPEVRHFLYKSRPIAQFMSPAIEAPYSSPPIAVTSTMVDGPRDFPSPSNELQRLFSKYLRMHSRLHAQSRPAKLVYWVDDTENWLGWITSTFELYVAFEPLVKKSAAISAVNKLLKWIKKEEDRVFIVNAPTF